MGEGAFSDRAAIAFLIRQAGHARLARLGLLMLASSMTEGIGLLMLVPITQLVTQGDGGAIEPGWLSPLAQVPLGWLLLAVALLVSLRALIVYASNEGRRALDLRLARDLREMVHRALLSAEWRWLSRQNSADHASMIMHEADRVSGLIDQALAILTAALTLGLLILSAALISWQMTLAVAALGIVAALGMTTLRRRNAYEGEAYVGAMSDLQRQVANGLKHLRAARIAGAEADLAQDFTRASGRLVELEMRFFRSGHQTLMLFQIVAVCVLAGLVFAALELFALPLAIFLPVVAIIARIVPLVGNIQQGLRGWRYNVPALASVLALVEEAQAQREPTDPAAQDARLTRALELRKVTLQYAGRYRPVLDRFDLALPARSVLAITGPSGSGKSSLADMLAGLIVPDAGEVLLDGEPLDASRRAAWRKRVAYVEQDPFLFDGSIAANLAWGRGDVSEAVLWRSLDAASADFVRELPDGLATRMGEGGRQFSGGEQQRIALARALITEPDLLVLDEVSAGLDRDNTQAIMQSIDALRARCTVVILSHDPLLADMTDQIVTLDRAGADE